MVELFCRVSSTGRRILNLTSCVIMNNRTCNVARADLQKIMALKRAILESAELLGYKQYQIARSCDCFCVFLLPYPQNILKPHPITKYDALRTSVQKKSGHSEQPCEFDQTLIFPPPAKKISGLARETRGG